jgi:hypothetical protein
MPSGKRSICLPQSIDSATKKNGNQPSMFRLTAAMRQYLIDELSFLERDNIDSYLKRTLKPGPLAGVYWLEVPQDVLAPPQLAHPNCGPFYFTVMLEKTELRAEFLVRSSHNMHCSCIAWATPIQRQFVLDCIDNMLKEEFISV